MENKFNQIKADLRLLKKLTHCIDADLRIKDLHLKRLEILKQKKQTDDVKTDIELLEKIINDLDIDTHIHKMLELENKYTGLINRLEPTDKTIIIEAFLNGHTYFWIGNKVGYSEVGVQKRVNKIIKLMSEMN